MVWDLVGRKDCIFTKGIRNGGVKKVLPKNLKRFRVNGLEEVEKIDQRS